MHLTDCGVCLPPCDFLYNCNPDVFGVFVFVGCFSFCIGGAKQFNSIVMTLGMPFFIYFLEMHE